jgi:patatin-like phospholipase/acyl hydrolase
VSSDRFQILALDGGGIKGMYSAAVLARIEEQLQVRLADHFDLIAGTSTGGIIALAMGARIEPSEVVDLYERDGPQIFGHRRAVRRAWQSKYSASGLRDALTAVFGERLLGSSATPLVIPSFCLDTGDVHVFKTPHHPRLTRDHSIPMVDVAMATTAAPTYLPALQLGHKLLVDGGVWANNPTLVAIAEAHSLLDVALDSIRVLSVGTTTNVADYSRRLRSGGLVRWARPASDVLLRAQAFGTSHIAHHLLGLHQVVRVDDVVPPGRFRLDRADLDALRAHAEERAAHASPHVSAFTDHIPRQYRPEH